MAVNTIALAQLWLDNLQKIWKAQSKTAVLEKDSKLNLEGCAANEVKVPSMTVSGLKDYAKDSGYTKGSATLTWTTLKLTQDRGAQFCLDAMDDLESVGVVGGNLMSEFLRTQCVPEIDAYRFSKIALGSAAANRTYAEITTAAAAKSALDVASAALTNAEVPEENRILFCTHAFYQLLKNAFDSNRFYTSDEKSLNRNFEYLDSVRIITVPTARFNVNWAKNDAGGFTGTAPAINFMLVSNEAVQPVVKHNPIRIFTPEQNQSADGWLFNYRLYHDLFVLPNKSNGIYLHTSTEVK